jgi:5-methylcytosine-specific restriction enzyme A
MKQEPTISRNGSTRRWRTIRLRVLRRDPVCMICGRAPSVEVDHILPVSRGGELYRLENLQGTCLWCNRSKGSNVAGQAGRSHHTPTPTSRDW